MEYVDESALWQALHTAYEEHNPEEARRLLNNETLPVNCCLLQNCSDMNYLRWLLDNRLIVPPTESDAWPDMQEKQLQCDALPESKRPDCILEGEWEKPASI